jgi:outer membrane protein OmpA-like peptidoglycan-associated protein
MALLAVVMLALAACATHPRPQSPPPPPLSAKRSHSVSAPQVRARAPLAPAPANNGDSLAPADVGYYMDVLQGRLKQVMGNIGISRKGDRIVLDLTSRMTFGAGSTQLGAGDHAILAPLSKVLVEYRMTLVSVRVCAADPATHAIDARFSEQRAQAIANDLTEDGVGPKRILIAGVGTDNRVHVELSLEPIVSAAGNGH